MLVPRPRQMEMDRRPAHVCAVWEAEVSGSPTRNNVVGI